jgi:hypothetical protein
MPRRCCWCWPVAAPIDLGSVAAAWNIRHAREAAERARSWTCATSTSSALVPGFAGGARAARRLHARFRGAAALGCGTRSSARRWHGRRAAGGLGAMRGDWRKSIPCLRRDPRRGGRGRHGRACDGSPFPPPPAPEARRFRRRRSRSAVVVHPPAPAPVPGAALTNRWSDDHVPHAAHHPHRRR